MAVFNDYLPAFENHSNFRNLSKLEGKVSARRQTEISFQSAVPEGEGGIVCGHVCAVRIRLYGCACVCADV